MPARGGGTWVFGFGIGCTSISGRTLTSPDASLAGRLRTVPSFGLDAVAGVGAMGMGRRHGGGMRMDQTLGRSSPVC